MRALSAGSTDNNNGMTAKYSGFTIFVTRYFWPVELIIALGVMAFSSYAGVGRYVSQGLMIIVFAVFTLMCALDIRQAKTQPCRCFGNLSQKSSRPFSCIRNGMLCLVGAVGIFAEPASLSFVGICLSALVLGAILYEEIR